MLFFTFAVLSHQQSFLMNASLRLNIVKCFRVLLKKQQRIRFSFYPVQW